MSGDCQICNEHPVDCQCHKKKAWKLKDKYKEMQYGVDFVQPGTKMYKLGGCRILISPPFAKAGWHMSISTCYRDPTWQEIRDAWYDLVPDAENRNAAMFFPPQEEYVNLQKYCFHVHEVSLDLKMSL